MCPPWNSPSISSTNQCPCPPNIYRCKPQKPPPVHFQCSWLILGLSYHNANSGNPVPWRQIRIQCRTELPMIQPRWFWFYSKGSLPTHPGVRGLPSAPLTRLSLPELHGRCPGLCFYFICNPLKAIASSGRWIIFCREAAGDGWDRLSLPEF